MTGKSKKVKIADLAPNISEQIFLDPYGYIGSAEKLIPSTRDQFDRRVLVSIKNLGHPDRSRVLGIGRD